MMKYATLFLVVISFCAHAKMVPNTEMLKLYEAQKPQTRVLMAELNEVMKITEPVFDLYEHMDGLTPEAVALSRHLLQIQEKSDQLYGKEPTITPFSSCRTLTRVAYDYWLEKMNSFKSKNEKQLNTLFNKYNKLTEECSKQIKTPPPKTTEDVGIIDVTQ